MFEAIEGGGWGLGGAVERGCVESEGECFVNEGKGGADWCADVLEIG